MRANYKIFIASIIFFSENACKQQPTDNLEVNSQIELHVFKTKNTELREAINKNPSFQNISFLGNEHDYLITLVATSDSKDKADKIIESAKKFALNWGKLPKNQLWTHSDDGFHPNGKRKYKRVIEDSVTLTKSVTSNPTSQK